MTGGAARRGPLSLINQPPLENLLGNSGNGGKLPDESGKSSPRTHRDGAHRRTTDTEARDTVCGAHTRAATKTKVSERRRARPKRAHRVSGTHRRNWDISPQFDANGGGRRAVSTLTLRRVT